MLLLLLQPILIILPKNNLQNFSPSNKEKKPHFLKLLIAPSPGPPSSGPHTLSCFLFIHPYLINVSRSKLWHSLLATRDVGAFDFRWAK